MNSSACIFCTTTIKTKLYKGMVRGGDYTKDTIHSSNDYFRWTINNLQKKIQKIYNNFFRFLRFFCIDTNRLGWVLKYFYKKYEWKVKFIFFIYCYKRFYTGTRPTTVIKWKPSLRSDKKYNLNVEELLNIKSKELSICHKFRFSNTYIFYCINLWYFKLKFFHLT